MCPAPARGNAEFPTPTARDALTVAIATFEAGQRVDMAQIADRLGVGRSTLYRWVGDREALMDRVLEAGTRTVARNSRRRLRGKGLDRVANSMRAYLEAITRYAPLRSLTDREPHVALQLVMNPEGAFARTAREQLRQVLQDELPDVAVPDDVIEVLTATSLAYVWGSIAGGYDPGIDRAIAVLRTVVAAQSA